MTQDERIIAFAEWYLHGRHRALWMVPLSFTLVLFVVVLLLGRFSEDPHVNLVSSRAGMEKHAREIPDSENAYLPLRIALMNRTAGEPNIDDAEDPATIAHWVCNQAVIKEILAALERPESWSGHESLNPRTPMRHISYSELDATAQLLSLEARMRIRRNDLQRNDLEAAVCALRALAGLSRRQESESPIIRRWWRESLHQAALDTFYAILLQERALDEYQLKRLAECLPEPSDAFSDLAAQLSSEQDYLLYCIDLDYSGLQGFVLPGIKGKEIVYGSDRACLAGVYEEFIGKLRKRETPDLTESITRLQRGPAPFTRAVVGRLYFERRFWMEDQLRLLHVAFALRRYQVKFRRDPHSLANLIPEFISALPDSIRGGNGIRMRASESGELLSVTAFQWSRNSRNQRFGPRWLVLYTAGGNQIDDGGVVGIPPESSDDTVLLMPTAHALGIHP